MRGVGLRAADRNGKSDPYVVAHLGSKHKKKSRVVKKTLDPEWDEVLEFDGTLRDFLAQPLLLKVYDWDRLSFNDLLGEVSVGLDGLRGASSQSFSLRLSTQGRVELDVRWVPNPYDPRKASTPPTGPGSGLSEGAQHEGTRRRRLLFGSSSSMVRLRVRVHVRARVHVHVHYVGAWCRCSRASSFLAPRSSHLPPPTSLRTPHPSHLTPHRTPHSSRDAALPTSPPTGRRQA